MSFRKMRRLLSFCVSICFLWTEIVYGNPQIIAAQFVSRPKESGVFLQIEIPPELGMLDKVYYPDTDDAPFIFHLQTIHANYETSQKIRKLIVFLQEKYGVEKIFVEGGAGKLRLDLLKFFQDSSVNAQMLNRLAEMGMATGVDLAVSNLPMDAVGIEDPDFYSDAFQIFRKVIGNMNESLSTLNSFYGELEREASNVFTKDLKILVKEWRQFESNHKNFSAVIKYLREESRNSLDVDFEDPFTQFEWPQLSRLIQLQELEKKFDPGELDSETGRLKEWLIRNDIEAKFVDDISSTDQHQKPARTLISRSASVRSSFEDFLRASYPKGFRFADYPQFTYQAAFHVLQDEVESKRLFKEINKLFDRLLNAKANDKEKPYLEKYRKLVLLEKLLRLELNRGEWQKIQSALEFMKEYTAEIPLHKDAIRFYELSEKREAAFMENIQEGLRSENKRIAILVTGGFHTENMEERFNEEKIGYATITPKITGEIDASLYHKIMLGKANLEKPEMIQLAGTGTLTEPEYVRSEARIVKAIYDDIARKSPPTASEPLYFEDRSSFLTSARSEMRSDPFQKPLIDERQTITKHSQDVMKGRTPLELLMTPNEAIRHVDLTDFASDQDAEERMRHLAERAAEYDVPSISTYSQHFQYLPLPVLKQKGTRIGGVVAFPHGLNADGLKEALEDTLQIVAAGGDEIDLVLEYRAILEGQPEQAEASLKAFRDGLAAIEEETGKKVLVKTIIETQALGTEEKIREAARIALRYSDLVKLVTGFPIRELGIEHNRGSLQAAKIILEEIKLHYQRTGELKGLKITGGIWYWDQPDAPDRSVLPYLRQIVEVMGEDLAYRFFKERDLLRIGGNKLLEDLGKQAQKEKRLRDVQETLSKTGLSWNKVQHLARKAADIFAKQHANVVFEWNSKENRWLFRRSGLELSIDSALADALGRLMPARDSSLLFPFRSPSAVAIEAAILSALKSGVSLEEALQDQGLKAIRDFKKVLLIAPYGDQRGQPLKYVAPHKGVEYISHVLLRELEDVDSRVYNPNLTSPEALYDFVSQENFDVIGFSLLQGVVEKNTEILARVHQIQPEALMMLGGHELPRIAKGLHSQEPSQLQTPLPALGADRHPFMDFIEAVPVDVYVLEPANVIDVLREVRPQNREQNLRRLEKVPNLIVVNDQAVVRTQEDKKKFFPEFPDIEEDIPYDQEDLIHGTHYSEGKPAVYEPISYDRIGRKPLRVVLSDFCSAGCCFCGVNEFKRPPPPVKEVMQTIRENFNGHDSIHFEHVDFLFNVPYAIELAQALRDSEYRTVPKLVVSRVGKVTDEVMQAFAGAGIQIIAYGIESFDDEILNHIGKKATVEQNIHALETTLRHGVRPGMNIILFTPWDTVETMRRTADGAISYALRGAYLNIVPIIYAGYGRPITQMPAILDYSVLDFPGMKQPLHFPQTGKILDPELRELRPRVEELKDELFASLPLPDQHKTVSVESLLWIKAFYLAYQEINPSEDMSGQLRSVDQVIAQTVDAQMKTVEGKLEPFQTPDYPHLDISAETDTSFQVEAYIKTKFPVEVMEVIQNGSDAIEVHHGPLAQTEIYLKNMEWRGYQITPLEPEADRPSRFYRLQKGEDKIYVVSNIVGPSRELFILQSLHYFRYSFDQVRIRKFGFDTRAIYDQAFSDYRGNVDRLIITHEVDRYIEVMQAEFAGQITAAEKIESDMVLAYNVEFENGKRLIVFDMQNANGQQIETVIRYFADEPEKGGLGVRDITVHGAAGGVVDDVGINDILLYTHAISYEGHRMDDINNDVSSHRFSRLLRESGVSVHQVPFYEVPTVLNGSIELIERIEKAGGGAVELELVSALRAVKDYPDVKFRAFYETHDKPANRLRSKENTLSEDIPGYRDWNKRRAAWIAVQRTVLADWTDDSFGRSIEGFERLRRFKEKSGQATKIAFVALAAPEYPTFSETYGISAIAGDLKHHFGDQVDITILDMNADPALTIENIAETLIKDLPDAVAFSVPFYSFVNLRQVMDELKRRVPEDQMPLLIAGKSLPNYQHERLLNEHYPDLIAVQGEGEVAMRSLVSYRNGELEIEDIKNIAYRKEGQVVVHPRESLDLSTAGLPYREHLDPLTEEGGQVFIETCRGCYWSNCTFCAIRGLLGSPEKELQWRTFPTERVLDAFEALDKLAKTKNPNYANISIADEEFLGHSEAGLRRAIALAKGIKARGLNVRFRLSTTAKSVWDKDDTPQMTSLRRETLLELKEAGLEKVFLGLESGSDSQLKKINKGITADENRNAVLLLRNEIGLEVDVGFIMFNPLSTFEELKENIVFVEQMDVWQSISSLFNEARVYIGTTLARLLKVKYPELISENYDMETGNYDVRFLDSKVAEIYKIVKEWEQGDHLVEYHLKTMTRNRLLSTHILDFLGNSLIRWRMLNLDLLKGLVQIYDRDANERDVSDFVRELRRRRLSYVHELLSFLNEDKQFSVDQKERLRKALQSVLDDEIRVLQSRSEVRSNSENPASPILADLVEGSHSSVRRAFQLYWQSEIETNEFEKTGLVDPVAQISASAAVVVMEEAFSDEAHFDQWKEMVRSVPILKNTFQSLALPGMLALLDERGSFDSYQADEPLLQQIFQPIKPSQSKVIKKYQRHLQNTLPQEEMMLLARPRGTYNPAFIRKLLKRIALFGFSVEAVRVYGGRWVEKNEILEQHAQDRAIKIAKGLHSPAPHEIAKLRELYGKKEFVSLFGHSAKDLPVVPVFSLLEQGLTKQEIIDLWIRGVNEDEFNAGKIDGINKIGDHFFVRPVKHAKINSGLPFFLANGFYFEFEAPFHDPSSRMIGLIIRATDNQAASLEFMRTHFQGETNAQKAPPGSIRRDAFDGIIPVDGQVSISQPVLHLSASPLEALKELRLWFRLRIAESEFGGILLKEGYTTEEIQNLLANQGIDIGGRSIDLFQLTASKSQAEALSLVKEYFPPFYGDVTPSMTFQAFLKKLDQYTKGQRGFEAQQYPSVRIREPESLRPLPHKGSLDDEELTTLGETAFREGKVGQLFLMGGRQGRFYGYDVPESQRLSRAIAAETEFEGQRRSLLELSLRHNQWVRRQYRSQIPIWAMTSELNAAGIENYFVQNDYFGLSPRDIRLFFQGELWMFNPTREDLKSKYPDLPEEEINHFLAKNGAPGTPFRFSDGRIAKRPPGHLDALLQFIVSGELDKALRQGTEYLYISDPSNAGLILDPALLGYMLKQRKEAVTTFVEKNQVYQIQVQGHRQDFTAFVRNGVVVAADLPSHLRISLEDQNVRILSTLTNEIIPAEIKIDEETGGVLISDEKRDFVLEGFRFEPDYDRSAHRYYATAHNVIDLKAILPRLGLNIAQYRRLLKNKQKLLPYLDEKIEDIDTFVDIKKVIDERSGEVRYGAQWVRLIGSIPDLLDTAFVTVDRDGIQTRVGYVGNKSTEELILNRDLTQRIMGNRTAFGDIDPEILKKFSAVVIDGFSGTGKTSLAKSLADHLGYVWLEFSALFRAASWFAGTLSESTDWHEVVEAVVRQKYEIKIVGREQQVFVNDRNITSEIYPDPSDPVKFHERGSRLAAEPEVQSLMQRLFKQQVEHSIYSGERVVISGRTVGRDILPGVDAKFFLTTDIAVRAQRYAADQPGLTERDALRALSTRDEIDMGREMSPVIPADGAEIIDTSDLTLIEAREKIIDRLSELTIRSEVRSEQIYEKFDRTIHRRGKSNLIFLGSEDSGNEVFDLLSSRPAIAERYVIRIADSEAILGSPNIISRIEMEADTQQKKALVFIDNITSEALPFLEKIFRWERNMIAIGYMNQSQYPAIEANLIRDNPLFLRQINFELWSPGKTTGKHQRIVVLGATGLIGRRVMKDLKSRGYTNILGVSRTGDPNLNVLSADLRNEDVLEGIVHGADVVINAAVDLDFQTMEKGGLAAIPAQDVNVGILEKLERIGFEGTLVHLSSYYVFGQDMPWAGIGSPRNPISAYGKMKKEAEDIALTLNQSLIIRLGPVIGFDPTARQKGFYRNVVDALEKARKGESYDLIPVTSYAASALMSPKQIAESIVDLFEMNHRGVVQISGNESLYPAEQVERITRVYNQIYGTDLQIQTENQPVDLERRKLTPNVQMLSVVNPDLDNAIQELILETNGQALGISAVRSEMREARQALDDLGLRIKGLDLPFAVTSDVVLLAERFSPEDPYGLIGALGTFGLKRPLENAGMYQQFLWAVIKEEIFGEKDVSDLLKQSNALMNPAYDGVLFKQQSGPENINPQPVLLVVDLKTLDERDLEGVKARLDSLPRGSVVIAFENVKQQSPFDLGRLMRSELRYVRVGYQDRIRYRALRDEVIQRSKEYGISMEHVGFLLSDLQLLEYEEEDAPVSDLGVVFEFSPDKVDGSHRILKGLSAAVFGEVVEATALDREIRDRLLAQGKASGFLNSNGRAFSFNISQLIDFRAAQIFSASA